MCCVPVLDSVHLDFRHQDDERTLEAEEELEAAEGAIDKAAELVNLSEEADMPLEKLLERYKMMASENGNLEHMNSKLRICSPKADDNATGHGMCAKDMDVVMVGTGHYLYQFCTRIDETLFY